MMPIRPPTDYRAWDLYSGGLGGWVGVVEGGFREGGAGTTCYQEPAYMPAGSLLCFRHR